MIDKVSRGLLLEFRQTLIAASSSPTTLTTSCLLGTFAWLK